MTRIHVVCSARNAGPWLGEMLASLVAQTHEDWVLSIRDDASTDDTWRVIEAWQQREPRIASAVRGDRALGPARGFAQVLAGLPQDAAVVATADADDVWLPHKLELSLRVLRAQPDTATTPILVHTDLRPVDVALRDMAPSFWRHVGLRPHATTPRLVAIQNVAVGPTQLFNAPLLACVRQIPAEAPAQDWWIALVAASLGRLVPIDEPTVLYRRHATNHSAMRASGFARARQVAQVLMRRGLVGRQLDEAAQQAGAVVRLFGERMTASDRVELRAFARIAELRGLARRGAVLRWRWHPHHRLVQNLGMVLRA